MIYLLTAIWWTTDGSSTVHVVKTTNTMHWIAPLIYSIYKVPTYFDSSLLSSVNFLDPSELHGIQNKYVVYHIMYVYVACVPECCDSACCASQPQLRSRTNRTTTLRHTGHINIHYMIYHLFYLHFKQLRRIQEAP
jgi:hypothetical protein